MDLKIKEALTLIHTDAVTLQRDRDMLLIHGDVIDLDIVDGDNAVALPFRGMVAQINHVAGVWFYTLWSFPAQEID